MIEDTAVTLRDLKAKGFSDDLLAALDLLTKKRGQTYDEYIAAISRDPLVRVVKIANLEDNMNLSELPEVGEKELSRLRKYRKALLRLKI